MKISKDSPARCYQKNKDRLQNIVPERYQDLSEEGNNKKHQYGHEQYEILPKHEKHRLVEYRRKYKEK